jgi:hypothetical protein
MRRRMSYESKKFAAYRGEEFMANVATICIGSGRFLVGYFVFIS